eukprot:jgi/Botrbrau1/8866/Bobra.50_2s0023.2
MTCNFLVMSFRLSAGVVARGAGTYVPHGLPLVRPIQLVQSCCRRNHVVRGSTYSGTSIQLSISQETDPARPDHEYDGIDSSTRSHFSELYMMDFALVAKEHVVLHPGLTVITGESGAGKSVLVAALAHILGAPTSEAFIRPPSRRAIIEGKLRLTAAAKAAAWEILAMLDSFQEVTRGAPDLPSELCLRREVLSPNKAGGGARSRCFVNGKLCSLRVLRQLGAALVDMNGQNSVQALRDTGAQLRLLDAVAGTTAAAARFANKLRQLRETEAELREADALQDERERLRQESLVQQVGRARVEEGEERRLRARLRQMEAERAALERCSLVRAALSPDDSGSLGSRGSLLGGLRALEGHVRAVVAVQEAALRSSGGPQVPEEEGAEEDQEEEREEDVEEARDGDAEEQKELLGLVETALDQLETARGLLQDVSQLVGTYARRNRWQQEEYEETTDRLQSLERLFKQWECGTSEELLALSSAAQASLQHWAALQGGRGEAEANAERLRRELVEEGAAMSVRRRAAAGKLRAAVEASLADLGMAAARFDIRIGWQPSPEGLEMPAEVAAQVGEGNTGDVRFASKATGFDSVEFLLAAGPSEPLRPLAAVASGGEASRIMLALKAAPALIQPALLEHASALSRGKEQGSREVLGALGQAVQPEGAGGPPVLILDEVDAGMGARLGNKVGRLLQRIATPASGVGQVLCVSHLPQVAAHAEHHICVRKGVEADGRPLTRFQALREETQRIEEVADMLGMGREEALQLLRAASEVLPADLGSVERLEAAPKEAVRQEAVPPGAAPQGPHATEAGLQDSQLEPQVC